MTSAEYRLEGIDNLSPDCDVLVPNILGSSYENDVWSPPLYMTPAYVEKLNNRTSPVSTNLQELFKFPNEIFDEQSYGSLKQTLDLEGDCLQYCLPSISDQSASPANSQPCNILAPGIVTPMQEIAPNSAQLGAVTCVQSNRADRVSPYSIGREFAPRAGGAFHVPDYMHQVGKVAEETSASRVKSDLSCTFENIPTSSCVATELDSLSEFQQYVASICPLVVSNRQIEGMEGLISASCSTISSNNDGSEDDGAFTGNSGRITWCPKPAPRVFAPDFSTEDTSIPTASFYTPVNAQSSSGNIFGGAASQFERAWHLNSENSERCMPLTTSARGAALESGNKETTVQLKANETCWSSRHQQDMQALWSDLKIDKAPNARLGEADICPCSPRSLKHPKSKNQAYVAPSQLRSNKREFLEQSLSCAKEMLYRAAALRPVEPASEVLQKPKRRNVKISKDPQSVAARHRREKISEKIRILQRLVPGGMKMDTASMLDEAVQYLKFLKTQVHAMNNAGSTLYPS